MGKPNKILTLCILVLFCLAMTGTALAKPGNGKGNGKGNKGGNTSISETKITAEDQETETKGTDIEDTDTENETDTDADNSTDTKETGKNKNKNKNKETREFKNQVKVKGTNVNFDIPPVIKDGRLLIPVRGVMNSLGADVAWDPETQTVTVTKDDQVVVLTLGSETVLVNGVETTIDVPAQTESNRTVVPIRFLATTFGKIIEYDDETGDVIIEDPETPPADGTDTPGDQTETGTDTTTDPQPPATTEPPADNITTGTDTTTGTNAGTRSN